MNTKETQIYSPNLPTWAGAQTLWEGRYLGKVGDALHSISCAAGYNLRRLLRAIARLGIGALFLRLLQAALLAPQTTAGSYGTHRRAWTDA